MSGFEDVYKKLSTFVKNSVVKEILRIDNDACIQIIFLDNSMLIIDAMIDNTARSGAVPLINLIDTDGEYVEYFT